MGGGYSNLIFCALVRPESGEAFKTVQHARWQDGRACNTREQAASELWPPAGSS